MIHIVKIALHDGRGCYYDAQNAQVVAFDGSAKFDVEAATIEDMIAAQVLLPAHSDFGEMSVTVSFSALRWRSQEVIQRGSRGCLSHMDVDAPLRHGKLSSLLLLRSLGWWPAENDLPESYMTWGRAGLCGCVEQTQGVLRGPVAGGHDPVQAHH